MAMVARRVAKVARLERRGRSTLVSKIGTSGATKRARHWVQTLAGTGFCGPSAALIRLERTSQGLPRERSECFGYSLRESSCGVNRKVNCAAREATLGYKSLCLGHHGIHQRFPRLTVNTTEDSVSGKATEQSLHVGQASQRISGQCESIALL